MDDIHVEHEILCDEVLQQPRSVPSALSRCKLIYVKEHDLS